MVVQVQTIQVPSWESVRRKRVRVSYISDFKNRLQLLQMAKYKWKSIRFRAKFLGITSHTNIPSEVVKQELAQFETSKNCSLYFLRCNDIHQLISFHLEGPLKTIPHLSSPDGTLDPERPIVMVVVLSKLSKKRPSWSPKPIQV